MKQRGFTLIELLIVVAIIAILAAIAVPNFLEAQTRAKVSRAKSDMRTLVMAVESYRIDGTKYPITPFYPDTERQKITAGHGWPWECGQWFILTTPIAYIASVPRDTFYKAESEHWGIWQNYYRVWNLSSHANTALAGATPWGYPNTVAFAKNGGIILIASVGPDRVEDISDGSDGSTTGIKGIMQYDPTNGTTSWGDIYYGMPGIGFELGSKIW